MWRAAGLEEAFNKSTNGIAASSGDGAGCSGDVLLAHPMSIPWITPRLVASSRGWVVSLRNQAVVCMRVLT